MSDATFGAYRVLSKLGGGGMGEVFLAEDTKLQRKVAIKLLLPGLSSSATASKRLLREARAAAALDHPNICAIYDVAEDEGRAFIVMQYVEGETLQARMRRGAPPIHEVLSIVRQVVDALSEAHAHDTIHRDIKPANIMITGRGLVKVMDFGLATSGRGGSSEDAETATGLTSPGSVLGTVPYMSPEQVRGEPLDARTDLFSVGVVLYELVTGHQPFAAPSSAGTLSAILTEEPQPLGRYSKDATAELERIVSKALRKDKDARYQTAKDLLIDLRTLEDEFRRTSSWGAIWTGHRHADIWRRPRRVASAGERAADHRDRRGGDGGAVAGARCPRTTLAPRGGRRRDRYPRRGRLLVLSQPLAGGVGARTNPADRSARRGSRPGARL